MGVGAFEGALSEGISDYLSATITDDSGLGRGFFVDAPDGPLRELNPDGDEARWPEDISGQDPHETGLIIAGTLWDLRELLRDKLGDAAGTTLTDKIWLHGWGEEAITAMINGGKVNQMPAQEGRLTESQIHVLTAYLWGFSNKPAATK